MFTSQTLISIQNEESFSKLALELFDFHIVNNEIYKKYCELLKINKAMIKNIEDIPFLPIQFFKSHKIYTANKDPEIAYASSGTTGSSQSKHFVADKTTDYLVLAENWFEHFFPKYKDHIIIGLLPSYLERKGSSLIDMVAYFINQSHFSESCFSLEANQNIRELLESHQPKIIFGVTYALLNLAEKGIKCKNTKVIETGGMKGMRKEIVREELHHKLKNGLGTNSIYSEYGMTELLSQAYSTPDNSSFTPPAWMKVFVRPTTDPLSSQRTGKGGLNIIDLANKNSCPFIATEDLGEVFENGNFNVSGRLDHSQTRGCNLLVT